MKVLFWGVSPWANSGYGVATRNLVPQLQKGHEVAVFAYAGLGSADREFNGAPVFRNPERDWGLTWIGHYCSQFEPDIVISWFDPWVVKDLIPSEVSDRLVTYAIIDSSPLSPPLKLCLEASKRVVPPSYWSKRVIEQAGLAPEDPIYHGVSTRTFYPQDKLECRRKLGLPEDSFIFFLVGTNLGMRKNIPNTMRAFKDFLDRCPEARRDSLLILHTHPLPGDGGYNLGEIWGDALKGPAENILFTRPDDYVLGISDEQMARRYGASDILVLCSMGEGFGFPVIEAGACGVPAIATNYSALPELVQGRGYLVNVAESIPLPLTSSWQAIPSTEDISRKMEYAYYHREEVKALGEKAREFALTLDWDIIGEKWRRLLSDIEVTPAPAVSGLTLDIGCGSHCRGDYGLDLTFETTATEHLDKLVGETRPDARLIKHDLNDGSLPFGDGMFDKVLAIHSLEHLRSPFNVLKEVKRVLKPDGRFICAVPNPRGNNADMIDKTHLYSFTSDALSNLLSQFFVVKKIDFVQRGMDILAEARKE